MESFEWVVILLALLYLAFKWLYRGFKAVFSRLRPSRSRPISSPIGPDPTLAAQHRWTSVAVPSALAAIVTVAASSLLLAAWLPTQPGIPADLRPATGYLAVIWTCIAGPFISVLAATAAVVTDNVFNELQARHLPRVIHLAVGAMIGFVFTILFASLLFPLTATAPGGA
jgi:hypothetical protein